MKKALLKGIIIIALVISLGIVDNAQRISKEYQFVAAVPSIQVAFANCSGAQLSLKEVDGDADMGGKRFGNYVFTNISSSVCTLSGYPVFTLLNKAGQVMRGVKVTYKNALFSESEEEKGNKAPVVKLEPGKTAWFQIFYTDGMANDLKKPPPSSAKVKVKAPQTTKEFIIKSEVGAYLEVQVSSIRDGLPNQ